MSTIEQQLLEDRALRDAACEVFLADIAHAREVFSGKGLSERLMGRVGEGAQDVLETARETAEDNRGILAILLGAILLWLSREPILEILGLSEFRDEDVLPETESADQFGDTSPPPAPPGEPDD